MEEKLIDKIGFTHIKTYNSLESMMRIGLFFSVKLTNKAIYSYLLSFIPLGKSSLSEIVDFMIVRKEMVGFSYFKTGIVIKSNEKGKIKEVIFGVSEKKLLSFVENLKKLGIKERKK